MKRPLKAQHIQMLVMSLLFSAGLSATDIYSWVDEDGVTHFSEFQPGDQVQNVSKQTMDKSAPIPVEDVYNVEEHNKQMAEWREERDQQRQESKKRKQLADQQAVSYPQPQYDYRRSFWNSPIYNRPPVRPPHKPRPPIEKPSPPSRLYPPKGKR